MPTGNGTRRIQDSRFLGARDDFSGGKGCPWKKARQKVKNTFRINCCRAGIIGRRQKLRRKLRVTRCVMYGRMGAEDLVKMQNFSLSLFLSSSPESRSRKREAAAVPVARCCRAIVQKSWTRRVSTWIKWPIARGYRSTGIAEKGEESLVIAKMRRDRSEHSSLIELAEQP